MRPVETPPETFDYSFWENYGTLIYGLLFPVAFLAWIMLSKTKMIHGEWGVVGLVLYYANLVGMAHYRLVKTPVHIQVTASQVTFVFLRGKSISWASGDIEEIEKVKCGLWSFADAQIQVHRRDRSSVMALRPDVRRGEAALLHAFQSSGIRVIEKKEEPNSSDR
jgi:hypothetical protein